MLLRYLAARVIERSESFARFIYSSTLFAHSASSFILCSRAAFLIITSESDADCFAVSFSRASASSLREADSSASHSRSFTGRSDGIFFTRSESAVIAFSVSPESISSFAFDRATSIRAGFCSMNLSYFASSSLVLPSDSEHFSRFRSMSLSSHDPEDTFSSAA
ncbi:hypothetical protein SDC9_176780 [bioreactor metagenome]|uniref:Uncharacterized protein n=1 Tax=bioreactor metagenome TaxID=1076179 RepID=A0A645GR06_9ZZZZ